MDLILEVRTGRERVTMACHGKLIGGKEADAFRRSAMLLMGGFRQADHQPGWSTHRGLRRSGQFGFRAGTGRGQGQAGADHPRQSADYANASPRPTWSSSWSQRNAPGPQLVDEQSAKR